MTQKNSSKKEKVGDWEKKGGGVKVKEEQTRCVEGLHVAREKRR